AGRKEQNNTEPEQDGEKRVPEIADHLPQAGERRRVSNQLEGPDKTTEARVARIVENDKDGGEGSEKIADPSDRDGPAQPRAPFAAVLGLRRAGRGDQSKDVFEKEKATNDSEPQAERLSPVLSPIGLGFGEHDTDTSAEHHMVRAAKNPCTGTRGLRVKQPEKPLPPHILF
ncbi:MAG: hypothetical protein JO204_14840, partial [Alphaproteobacteria bacterium]|nr:hypothetical protein [Alphaproteobacteria bacterium]